MQKSRHERRDWFIIIAIIVIGFLCMIMAGMMALRFAPSWELRANMDSSIDPNSDYLTNRPVGFIQPIDPSILTPPVWLDIFQTPGASVPARTPLPTRTSIPLSTPTNVPAATQPATGIPISTNTVIYYPPPSTATPQPEPRNTSTPTATLPVDADLGITKSDGVTIYAAGGTVTYVITITNSGPADAIGATISDAIPPQITSWIWKCTAENGGATGCDSVANSTTGFNDSVNLPNGASIEYTVTASVSSGATGDLINTATIAVPAGLTELDNSNNSATDTDKLLVAATFPYRDIGDTKDGTAEIVLPGVSITLTFTSPIVVGGHGGWDLVYYELPNGTGIAMDHVILEIGDGTNWYQIFNWGNGSADTNSNLNIDVIGPAETDNRLFTTAPASDILYNSSGVVIELDGFVPNGTYPYIRLISPPGDDGDGIEVDAIVVLP